MDNRDSRGTLKNPADFVSLCYDLNGRSNLSTLFLYNMRVSNAASQMPASTATVKTATKKSPVRRKRSTATKSRKAVVKVVTVKRPSSARLISGDRYLKDFQTRWAIHTFEINELVKDFSKGFKYVRQFTN